MAASDVGSRELKTRLGAYLQRVRDGQSFIVTDRGQPVAELRPIGRGTSTTDKLARLAAKEYRDAAAPRRPGCVQAGTGPEGRVCFGDRLGRPRGPLLTRYFDASALVKRYVAEAGSVAVRRLMREPVATSRLSEVEIASALARLAREGAMSAAERDRALERLTEDFQSFWVVETTREVVALARILLIGYPLRAGDALQLASCQYLRRELSDNMPMVVFDDRLVRAAREERVPVVP